jgi:hypothetical protein
VVRSHRNILSNWREAAVASALVATALIAVPVTARAGGLFDLFFSGFQQRPANVNSYAEPPAPIGRVAPVSPGGSESVNQGSDTGHGVAFCVRLCDGQHFPLEARVMNATPVEACRSMCPASRTKVFYGAEIDHAVAKDGSRYGDLDTAFIYRKQLVANCTCNGKDALGLAPYDLPNDPTLRPGDIVATKTGLRTYTGNVAQAYTPVTLSNVATQLNSVTSTKSALNNRRPAVDTVDDDPGTIAQAQPLSTGSVGQSPVPR